MRQPGVRELRASFWLHEIDVLRIRVPLDGTTPADYTRLTVDEKLCVAEFVDFLHARRSDPPTARRRKFFLRDHANRPAGTQLATPATAPAAYADCTREERFHVHEFIAFLLRRRTLHSRS